MNEQHSAPGVWNGIHWRFVGITVVAIAVLQVIASFAFKYPVLMSLPLALLVVSYLVIPRVKVRRLMNAMIGVVAMFIIGVLLELFVDGNPMVAAQTAKVTPLNYVESNGFALVLGLVVAFAYLKLTEWSEKKRAQSEARRSAERAVSEPARPVRRHNSKYAKKKKRKK